MILLIIIYTKIRTKGKNETCNIRTKWKRFVLITCYIIIYVETKLREQDKRERWRKHCSSQVYHKLIQMALYRPSNVSYKSYEKLKVIHIMEGKQKAKSFGKNQKSSTHIITLPLGWLVSTSCLVKTLLGKTPWEKP